MGCRTRYKISPPESVDDVTRSCRYSRRTPKGAIEVREASGRNIVVTATKRSDWRGNDVTFEVRRDGANVTVCGAGDRVTATSGNGDLEVKEARGDVEARTGNGDILSSRRMCRPEMSRLISRSRWRPAGAPVTSTGKSEEAAGASGSRRATATYGSEKPASPALDDALRPWLLPERRLHRLPQAEPQSRVCARSVSDGPAAP